MRNAPTFVQNQAKIVSAVMDAVLPPKFDGPAHLSRNDAYFDWTLDALGVKKIDDRWTWTSVHYERKTHFPFWLSLVRIDLGEQK